MTTIAKATAADCILAIDLGNYKSLAEWLKGCRMLCRRRV
jgi:hypothetical protein